MYFFFLLAQTMVGCLLLPSISLAFTARPPPHSFSSTATSVATASPTPSHPPLQRTCGPSKLSVCCVVSSNSTTAATETATSLPGLLHGRFDGDDTEDNGAGEDEDGSGRIETTFDVTPLTVHSCRLKEG
ncbi:hypothetical protein D0861_08670 [Hortaea werneckii]|uniref:Secreted protein n=1 Tax=Hortaea werneckii TaxID=91943 RepID=A0A3M7ETK5_HORWE|nr:hypothetical protein D0861_08670 [Hortaea werneckii]